MIDICSIEIYFVMETQANINYNRIARAIDYINENFKSQPTINEVAATTTFPVFG